MNKQGDYVLQMKRWADLPPSLKMYGESEPPDVKARWDMKNREWENQKDKYNRIERMARAEFLADNPDLPLARALAKTSYGKELLVEGRQGGFIQPKVGDETDLHGESGGVYGGGSNVGNNAVELFGRDSILGTLPRRHNVKTYYVWKANEGACDACTSKNGEQSATPTMERPHPNCKCRQVECQEWEERSKWLFVKEMKTIKYEVVNVWFDQFNGANGIATWHRHYSVEEERTVIKIRKEGDEPSKELSKATQFRKVRRIEVRLSSAMRFCAGRDIQNGDLASAINPWTGKSRPI